VSVALVDLVKQLTGQHLHLEFVPTHTAEQGFTSSTFSFNLPPLPGKSLAENEALAQRFVDLLAEKKSLFKPCVSFGQDNGLVYATVPATSTQVFFFFFPLVSFSKVNDRGRFGQRTRTSRRREECSWCACLFRPCLTRRAPSRSCEMR
jgi:hypothetical protein